MFSFLRFPDLPDDIALKTFVTLVLPEIVVLRLARSWSCLRFDDDARISCLRLNQLWFPTDFLQSRSETLSRFGRVEKTVSRWLWFCLWSLQVRLMSRLRLVKQSLQGKQLPSGSRSREARRLLSGMQFQWERTPRQVKPVPPGSQRP